MKPLFSEKALPSKTRSVPSTLPLLMTSGPVKELGPEKKVVTILPDRGERYLSVWEQRTT